MNETQLEEFFQITENIQKYGSIRLRFPLKPAQSTNPRYPIIFSEEPSAEQRERFFQRLNTPYGI